MSLSIITGPMFSGKCLEDSSKILMMDDTTRSVAALKVGDVLRNGNIVTYVKPHLEGPLPGHFYYNDDGSMVIFTPNHLHIIDGKPQQVIPGTVIDTDYMYDGTTQSTRKVIAEWYHPYSYTELSVSGDNTIPLSDGHITHNTSALIADIERYTHRKKLPIIIKHSMDTRYTKDTGAIITHNGIKYNSVDIIFASSLSEADKIVQEYDVIGVDEAQFFNDIEYLRKWAFKDGKDVTLSGLASDFRGKPFGRMPEIMAMATKHVSLTSICSVCNDRDATYNHRIISDTDDQDIVSVGSEDKYIVSCMKCLRDINHPLLDDMPAV